MTGKPALWTSLLGIFLIATAAHGADAPAKESPAVSTAAASPDADFDQFDKDFGKDKAKPVSDPLRGYNRFMFKVNDKFYFWVGKPLTTVYRFILPQPVRVAIGRGFENLGAPLRIVNNGLEGNFKGSGTEISRLVVNSTLGIGGLFDPADKWLKLKQVDADFGQTMGHYGIGHGPPIVLPILGQSNLRDGIGTLPNFLLNPVYYATSGENYFYMTTGGQFNYLSLHGSEYEKIKKEALDPYVFIRDAHLQYRDKRVEDSKRRKKP